MQIKTWWARESRESMQPAYGIHVAYPRMHKVYEILHVLPVIFTVSLHFSFQPLRKKTISALHIFSYFHDFQRLSLSGFFRAFFIILHNRYQWALHGQCDKSSNGQSSATWIQKLSSNTNSSFTQFTNRWHFSFKRATLLNIYRLLSAIEKLN